MTTTDPHRPARRPLQTDDVVVGKGTDQATGDVSIWMSLAADDWQQVAPESLRSPDLPDEPGAVSLRSTPTPAGSLLGSAFDLITDAGVGVARLGRPS